MLASEYMWHPWGKFHEAVTTGQPGFDQRAHQFYHTWRRTQPNSRFAMLR